MTSTRKSPVTDGARLSPGDSIAGMVDPIRAAGALLGFAVGAIATWRLGGDLTDSVLHGLVGAALMFPIAWFLGLVLVREIIRAGVAEQREDYDRRVAEARLALGAHLAGGGGSSPAGLPDGALPRLKRPSGS